MEVISDKNQTWMKEIYLICGKPKEIDNMMTEYCQKTESQHKQIIQ